MANQKLDSKQTIKQAIEQFSKPNQSLTKSSLDLFQALGYNTDRQSPLIAPTYQEFQNAYILSNLNSGKFSEERAQVKDWQYIDLLSQITSDELKDQLPGFTTQKIDDTIIESYLFFALELSKDIYSRSALSQITREINKLFPMPVMVLFKYGSNLSLAIIDRRLHKKDEQKDVLIKVTLIKDIDIQSPHRAHIEILYDLSFDELCRKYIFQNFVELHQAWQKALDTKELNKKFYKELSNWYFWAMDQATFPDDIEKNKEIRNATSLIRLITRIIFIWFIKEKGLIPEKLFDPNELKKILKTFSTNAKTSSFYQAILQNLFFGTLNQKMNDRKFAQNGCQAINKAEYGVKTLFRYDEQFTISKEQVIELFQDIPFLNGGLFDCLDKENEFGKVLYADGFSRNPAKQAYVPDFLFFGKELEVDLNKTYDTKNKEYSTKGLINILDSYKFTITENTPIEEEIALDPELLGKVFENLLASYNPETQTTARKSTGSFYTPREIVNYMVDESLIAYFNQKLEDAGKKDAEEKLRQLIGYNENNNLLTGEETRILIGAIDSCKILDPACGSGAFPMGILQKLVHVLHKIDPQNEQWKERQIQKARQQDISEIRDQSIADIESAFLNNELDYPRKLYLIENCIYGVDIQPIAIQIAKLRFFISLIIDQKKDPKKENFGIRSLPNLETKFVCANTLIGLEKPEGYFRDPLLVKKEEDLKDLRHDYFSSKTRELKLGFQKKDQALRKEISELLIKDGWGDKSAKQLSEWNPYDQNASSPFFDPEWMFGLTEGFDIVIANPPYLRIQGLQLVQATFVELYRENFVSAKGSFDMYALFIEKGYNLLNKNGVFSYIVPHKFFQASFGKPLRNYITKQQALYQVVRFGAEQVFDEVTTYTCLLFLTKKPKESLFYLEVKSLQQYYNVLISAFHREKHPGYEIEYLPSPHEKDDENWDFSIGEKNSILQRLKLHKKTLGSITRKIFQGIATSADKIYVLKVIEEKDNLIRCFSQQLEREIEIEKGFTRPFLMGKEVHRYERPIPQNVVIFPYWLNDCKAILMKQKEIEIEFPLGWKYLLENKQGLEKREHGRFSDNWWCFSRPQNMIDFCNVKLMTPEIALGCQMTLDEKGILFHTTKVYSFIFNNKTEGSIKYYLGLLNSKVLWYFLTQTGYILRGGYFTFKTNYLSPFPLPDYSSDKAKLIEIIVDYVLFLKAQPEQTEFKQTVTKKASIFFFEEMINSLVFELYFPEEFLNKELTPTKTIRDVNLIPLNEINTNKETYLFEQYRKLYSPEKPIRRMLFFLSSIPTIRIIEDVSKQT